MMTRLLLIVIDGLHHQVVSTLGAELLPNLSALRDATAGEARIYEGSGGVCLVDSYRRGIAGTMPGMEFLRGIVALWKALKRGDDTAIYRLYFPICALVMHDAFEQFGGGSLGHGLIP